MIILDIYVCINLIKLYINVFINIVSMAIYFTQLSTFQIPYLWLAYPLHMLLYLFRSYCDASQ